VLRRVVPALLLAGSLLGCGAELPHVAALPDVVVVLIDSGVSRRTSVRWCSSAAS
jgi:hypothetical protein